MPGTDLTEARLIGSDGFPRIARLENQTIAAPAVVPDNLRDIPFTEVEVRYFCGRSHLLNHIHRSPANAVGIHQSYFATWITKDLSPVVVRTLFGPEGEKELERFSKSRLRRTEHPTLGEGLFYEMKGSKDDQGTPERASPITREEYDNLRSRTKDYLFKLRDTEGGVIFVDAGLKKPIGIPIVVDIDDVLVAGEDIQDVEIGKRPKSGLTVPIIEVEITRETRAEIAQFFPDLEIDRNTIMTAIKKGTHNFPFLNVLICLDGHDLEDALSMRNLARNGFEKAESEIERYFKRHRRAIKGA